MNSNSLTVSHLGTLSHSGTLNPLANLSQPTTLPAFLPPRARNRRPAPRRWRDVLDELGLLAGLKAQLKTQVSAAEKVEKTLCKSAQRGRRIVLGTAEVPYEPLILEGAPLAALEQFEDLEIVITTRSPEIREQLELLVELDRKHAITVDMLVATDDPESPDVEERLAAVAALAAEGITTRIITTDLPEGRSDAGPRRTELIVRELFKAARKCQAYDVASSSPSLGGRRLIQRLRLEYGFPRLLPGRG